MQRGLFKKKLESEKFIKASSRLCVGQYGQFGESAGLERDLRMLSTRINPKQSKHLQLKKVFTFFVWKIDFQAFLSLANDMCASA